MNLPLNIDFQQVFLHMFNFTVLTGGMYFLLYKPVKDFMEKRSSYYAGLERETLEKMTQANLLKEEYEGKMAHAEKEIEEKKLAAVRDMERSRESEMAQTKKEAQVILENARERGEKEKERILAQAQSEIADMAAQATRKLLYETSAQAFDGFLDRAEGSVKND